MATNGTANGDHLLSKPSDHEYDTLSRTASTYNPLSSFDLPKGEKRHYTQQYADMYFARLAQLKPAVEGIGADAWSDFEIGGESARRVERVLDVRQGELCWVIGTCYMEMPLKPNVLDDIGKEHWIAAPPPRVKYTDGENDQIMLEDESGRLQLTGAFLKGVLLVTGAIVAVIGTENADGEFEVLDLRVADLPRQPQRWARDGRHTNGNDDTRPGKVAIVSGLEMSGDEGDTLRMDLLLEWLLGESAGSDDQQDAATISHLIIAGNSLSHGSPIPSRDDIAAVTLKNRGQQKYGYDSKAYNAAPTDRLDIWLSTLLPSLPITLLPGDSDPTSTQLPQQPIHAAFFPHSRSYMPTPTTGEVGWFSCMTNPAEFDLQGWRFLATGGQTVNDIYKYVHTEDRLEMMEAMLRWRLTAPTAPDTLWCYPFQDGDAFVLKECPYVYIAGNQPSFETAVIEGPNGQEVRLIAVPKFKETGEVVVLDTHSLEAEVVRFEIFEGAG